MAEGNDPYPEMHLEHVFFWPWRGNTYGAGSQWKLRVMVLGESHYGTNSRQSLTIDCVTDIIPGDWRHPFWTKVASLFCGPTPAAQRAAEFWNSVLFYNYIQELVGEGPGGRRSRQMWQRGAAGFLEVVTYYEPDFLLVLGKTLWSQLPEKGHSGPEIRLPDDRSRETWVYPHGSGAALAVAINHPASRGWKSEHWSPWVDAALNRARNLKRTPNCTQTSQGEQR